MPTLSNARLSELEQAERDLARIREDEMVRPFTAMLLELIGIYLAITPYEDWPSIAKAAMINMRGRAENAAKVYLARLPPVDKNR